MSMPHSLERQLRELHEARFKEFEEELLRYKALNERAAKYEPAREKRRRATSPRGASRRWQVPPIPTSPFTSHSCRPPRQRTR
jgi:hypothetical protein